MLRIFGIILFSLFALCVFAQPSIDTLDTTIREISREGLTGIETRNSPSNSKKNFFDRSIAIPVVAYNDNDGFGYGALFSRDILGVKVIAMPTVGRKSSNLGGTFSVAKNFDLHQKKNINCRLFFRSMSIENNELLDYTRRAFVFLPFFDYNFRNVDTVFLNHHRLSFRPTYVIEEYADFSTTGEYLGNTPTKLFIPSLSYKIVKESEKRSTYLDITVEGSQYKTIGDNSEHYVKTSLDYQYNYKFHPSRNGWLKLRFFGAGFPVNSQRKSQSFQNIFTRGSIAMIHQGYNDYAYSEVFLSRQNQTLSYDNQVSISQGGGFKTAVGSSYNIGLSNNFAFAFNGRVGVPWKFKLPLFAYFDTGLYSVYEGKKFVSKPLTNFGIGAHIGDVVHVFIPMFYSEELGNIHTSQHSKWYQRISFALEISNVPKLQRRSFMRRMKKFPL
jgi:hypothetical protein